LHYRLTVQVQEIQ